MDGKNDHAIVDALEAMTHLMGPTSQILQNQHGVGDDFCGLETFKRNILPTFKGMYALEDAQTWLQEIEKIFWVMVSTHE